MRRTFEPRPEPARSRIRRGCRLKAIVQDDLAPPTNLGALGHTSRNRFPFPARQYRRRGDQDVIVQNQPPLPARGVSSPRTNLACLLRNHPRQRRHQLNHGSGIPRRRDQPRPLCARPGDRVSLRVEVLGDRPTFRHHAVLSRRACGLPRLERRALAHIGPRVHHAARERRPPRMQWPRVARRHARRQRPRVPLAVRRPGHVSERPRSPCLPPDWSRCDAWIRR